MKRVHRLSSIVYRISNNDQRITIRGFTLIEMILYLSILSVMLIVLTELFVSIIRVQPETTSTAGIEEDGRYITTRLAFDVGRAQSIETPASAGNQSNTLSLTINGVSYTYQPNGNNLQLVNNLGTNVLNSIDTTVTNLTFLRLGNPNGKHTIKVSFTLTGTTKRTAGFDQQTFTTTVGIR